jgi:Protein of unknown function (DUF2530)
VAKQDRGALKQVEPPDPPMVPFAVAGIAVWAVLGLVLLAFHGWLVRHGHTNWLWTCVAGFVLGFAGLAGMIRHDRLRRARRSAAPPEHDHERKVPYDDTGLT